MELGVGVGGQQRPSSYAPPNTIKPSYQRQGFILRGVKWGPRGLASFEEKSGAWDVVARAPVAVTFTSLPSPLRGGTQGANFSPVQGQMTQPWKRPTAWTEEGSWRGFVVDRNLGVVTTMPSSGGGKMQIPITPSTPTRPWHSLLEDCHPGPGSCLGTLISPGIQEQHDEYDLSP